jgi:hypothetical protein
MTESSLACRGKQTRLASSIISRNTASLTPLLEMVAKFIQRALRDCDLGDFIDVIERANTAHPAPLRRVGTKLHPPSAFATFA